MVIKRIYQQCCLLALILLSMSCQGQKPITDSTSKPEKEQETISILVLLKGDDIPDKISALTGENIIKSRRSSRSQNLWTVTLAKNKESVSQLLEKLNAHPRVSYAKMPQNAPKIKVTNSTNLKQ